MMFQIPFIILYIFGLIFVALLPFFLINIKYNFPRNITLLTEDFNLYFETELNENIVHFITVINIIIYFFYL